MAYQFVHIETYCEHPKRVKGSKNHFNSARQVLGEAAREPHYSTHVDMPLPPQQFFGTLTLVDFTAKRAQMLEDLRETVTRTNGTVYDRKLRRDATTLYTEIHSHPVTSDAFLSDTDTHIDEVGGWMKCVKEDFKNRMATGVDYTSVIHLDEEYVHIHILAINTTDPKLDANALHTGKVAAAQFREANVSDAIHSLPKPDLEPHPKKPRKPRLSQKRATRARNDLAYATAVAAWASDCIRIDAANALLTSDWKRRNVVHLKAARATRGKPQVHKVYAAAMQTFQDQYYENVGKPCGLLRDGARQSRKSTKAHAADKRQAKRMADEIDRLNRKNVSLNQLKSELEARAHVLVRREEDVRYAIDTMEQIFDAFETGAGEVVNGKLSLPHLPPFMDRLSCPASETDPPSPMRILVRRFSRLLIRGHDSFGGGRAALEWLDDGPRG